MARRLTQRKLSQMGGRAKWKGTTKAERTAFMRELANRRWKATGAAKRKEYGRRGALGRWKDKPQTPSP